MLLNDSIWMGTSPAGAVSLLPRMANRHGLISGATGTGKTVSLQVLAEGFSQLGVPVFLADIKGDLAGLCKPGESSAKIEERMEQCRMPGFVPRGNPVVFWDVFGEKGHPIRTTVSEMGPLLFSRLLQLNDTQSGVMHILFRIADDEGLMLIDLKDVKAMLAYVGENASRYTLNYGNISRASVGAIQRAIAILEDQGGDIFFGEPALSLADWLTQDDSGSGTINILHAEKLFRKPVLYSTVMLWMLGELYDLLPEQGDKELPRMVFFFDEAHLLFKDCPKVLLERIEQTVRLIRSKGVGVFFVTQSPTDIPSSVLSQLSAKVQHALRAFTPAEQKVVRAAAQSFRANPEFDTEEVLTQLRTGEALLSFLQEDGTPGITQRAVILPPQSAIGTIGDDLRSTFTETDPIGDRYDVPFDRDSAYEMLARRMAQADEEASAVLQQIPDQYASQAAPAVSRPQVFRVFNASTGQYEERIIDTMLSPVPAPAVQTASTLTLPQAPTVAEAPLADVKVRPRKATQVKQEKSAAAQLLESFTKSATTSAGRTLGNQLARSILGTLGLGSSRSRKR